MAYQSTPDDLALHGVRVFGFATASRIAGRYRLHVDTVTELLLDFQASGWVEHLAFASSAGWSLTDDGRAENERRLTVELDRAGARDTVVDIHQEFVPLNRRFCRTCTDWQIRPARFDPMAINDHSDWRWDERVLRSLAGLGDSLRGLCDRLAECLARFDGYADRYVSALSKVEAGQRTWVDASDRDSCHLVWMQFHEDLVATLGLPRGSDN